MVKRTKIIQSAIEALGARTYLEIGTARGRTLLSTRVKSKIAVDVEFKIPWKDRIRSFWNTSYYQMPSDEYFRKYKHNFDVAFIDGLHTFEQSLRDAENCLERLNAGGIIIMHDCNPLNEKMASPTHPPLDVHWGGGWTGEVWKTIMTLRTQPELKVFVLDTDNGLGVVARGKPDELLKFRYNDIKNLTYRDLEKNREKFLNLKPPEYWFKFLRETYE